MKVSNLDLNWPEVTLAVVVLVVGLAAFRPELLGVVANFIKDISVPVGLAMGNLKFW